MEGSIGQDMAGKLLEKTGIKILSFLWVNGHRHLTTAKTPVYSPADLKNVKIRAPQAAIYVAAVKSLGANPVPIEFSELYMALQQGVVEGEENAYGTIEAKKFYEVQKYIMETGHILQSQVCMINNQFFQSLPKEYQKIVQEAADEAAVHNNKLYDESIEKGRKKFTKLGLTIIRPPELKIEQFRKGAKQYVPELVKIWGDPELYNKIISVE
jgi:tripartite ATP-independent transporter DctP family solute receptor